MILEIKNVLLILAPIVSISILGKFFPANNQPYKPIFQPPNWIFPIIWTYITVSLGIITNHVQNLVEHKAPIYIIYSIQLILLNTWLIINYYKKYKLAFWILVLSAYTAVTYCIYISNISNTVYYLIPMPFWLILASCLNGVIYDRTNQTL